MEAVSKVRLHRWCPFVEWFSEQHIREGIGSPPNVATRGYSTGRRLLKSWMQKERRNIPVPTKHFLAVVRIAFSACGVVAYHIEALGKRWSFGSPVRPAERNPVPSEQILFVMEPRVSAGHNPVITLGHGRILSESKSSRLASSACIVG